MSRPDLIIVLLEDRHQEDFIRKYLRARDFTSRQIRVLPTPAGKTKDVNFVLREYADQVNAQRNKYGSSALIVVIDADKSSVSQRKSELDGKLKAKGYEKRGPAESIAIVVPSRNIETWIWYLESNTVDETENYKDNPVRSNHDLSEVKSRFADYIISGEPPFTGCPLALQDARDELLRVPHK